jgi:hypothetical protein
LNLAAPITYRSLQFKGRCVACASPPGSGVTRPWIDGADGQMQEIGLPPGTAWNMFKKYGESMQLVWLTLTISSIFDQSPKPGAGAAL